MLGGCQRLKLQPHLASCDWALITCRVKFHQWIRGKEGARMGGLERVTREENGERTVSDVTRRIFVHSNVALFPSLPCWL